VLVSASRFGGNRREAMRVSDSRRATVALTSRQGNFMVWIVVAFVAVVAVLVVLSMKSVIVRSGTAAVLYRDGMIARKFDAGRHRWFDPLRSTEVRTITTLSQTHDGLEIGVMTRDQFSFRLRLAFVTQIVDALRYAEATVWNGAPKKGPMQFLVTAATQPFSDLYPIATATMLDAVGKISLDAFLADPAAILPAIRERLAADLPSAELQDVLITAITMPPEVRKMFTEVERAKREALASLEKARGEQASLRALANAARVLNNNPQLAQLRLLQTVDGAKGPKTFVLGSMPTLGSVASVPVD
jgi:regulator of protease activity HflC (stomatin/prohibitin superfamily)